MPKKVPDYSKSCIYKLLHKEDFNNVNCYVGSTTNFIQRKKSHKKTCNNENYRDYNLKLYQYIRQNGGWNNWTMIQIEPFICNSKKELETRERYWIEQLKSKLNCTIPTRTMKEWYNDNKDKLLEKQKQYNIDNKDKNTEYAKQYHIDNRDEILVKKKQYRIDYRDKRLEKDRQYYYDNRDRLLEKKKQKAICDNCGCEISKGVLPRHKRSQKCINFNSK